MAKRVRLHTSEGSFDLELYMNHAPKTCSNFLSLAASGYYTNTFFHRIVSGFCIQGGDPTGTGTGGESSFGGLFEDEITPDLRHTGAGILCMANQGRPDTNGSQFYISLAPLPNRDGKDTIFGRVCTGMRVVRDISLLQTDDHGRPRKKVLLERVECFDEDGDVLTGEG